MKKFRCPKCKAPLIPSTGEKLPGYLFCLLCGLAVRQEDAEEQVAEVVDGEET